ncbi:unnamed protein product [Lepeophtheirus salmonis]|uniref:(salmon louse) hypothetical protein n=1 Tax=Lepeophtheirus salmonis TaxID=72036 RepID=A0A7R8H6C3_LEPSM|nr:unnamed protein product [Lepeophtheirus salmonis]CAF2899072.1 unnamed protein product [Lepeophtheirus salmonis]
MEKSQGGGMKNILTAPTSYHLTPANNMDILRTRPVLNLLGFALRLHIEYNAYKIRHLIIDTLRASVNECWGTRNVNSTKKCSYSFRRRLTDSIQANGERIPFLTSSFSSFWEEFHTYVLQQEGSKKSLASFMLLPYNDNMRDG